MGAMIELTLRRFSSRSRDRSDSIPIAISFTRGILTVSKAIATQRSLQIVRAQIQSKEKERKILSLTMREIDAIPKDDDEVKMYKGVGKMFVFTSLSINLEDAG